jgi:hypothetical protein
VFDSEAKDFDFLIARLSPGDHTMAVKAADRSSNQSSAKLVVISKQAEFGTEPDGSSEK